MRCRILDGLPARRSDRARQWICPHGPGVPRTTGSIAVPHVCHRLPPGLESHLLRLRGCAVILAALAVRSDGRGAPQDLLTTASSIFPREGIRRLHRRAGTGPGRGGCLPARLSTPATAPGAQHARTPATSRCRREIQRRTPGLHLFSSWHGKLVRFARDEGIYLRWLRNGYYLRAGTHANIARLLVIQPASVRSARQPAESSARS